MVLLHLPTSSNVLLNNNFSVVVNLYVAVCLNSLPVTALHCRTRGQCSAPRLRDLAFLQSISPEPVFGCNPVSNALLDGYQVAGFTVVVWVIT